jgi:hypothetical protein
MKAEGQKKGDTGSFSGYAARVYCGMRIEMKTGRNTLSAEQIEWLRQLNDDGYYCVVCYGDKRQ